MLIMSTASLAAFDPGSITAIVLCGGLGRRMGVPDKPLVDAAGKPLVQHVLERVSPQAGSLMISCRPGAAALYERFGVKLVHDRLDQAGPLAGIEAGLDAATTDWCLVVPGDAPQFPDNLVERMWAARRSDSRVVYVEEHFLFMLVSRACATGLARWLDEGGRRVQAWLQMQSAAEVALNDSDTFVNINTEQDLAAWQGGAR